jgi:tetratricopeptide (TPR) repeat protein
MTFSFTPDDSGSKVCPGSIVFADGDPTLYVVSFRLSAPGSVKLFRIEGEPAGRWMEVSIDPDPENPDSPALMRDYKVATREVEPFIQNMVVAAPMFDGDTEPDFMRASYAASSSLLDMSINAFADICTNVSAYTNSTTGSEYFTTAIARLAGCAEYAIEAADAIAAALDCGHVGGKSFRLVSSVASEIAAHAIKAHDLFMEGMETLSEEAVVSALEVVNEALSKRCEYWAALMDHVELINIASMLWKYTEKAEYEDNIMGGLDLFVKFVRSNEVDAVQTFGDGVIKLASVYESMVSRYNSQIDAFNEEVENFFDGAEMTLDEAFLALKLYRAYIRSSEEYIARLQSGGVSTIDTYASTRPSSLGQAEPFIPADITAMIAAGGSGGAAGRFRGEIERAIRDDVQNSKKKAREVMRELVEQRKMLTELAEEKITGGVAKANLARQTIIAIMTQQDQEGYKESAIKAYEDGLKNIKSLEEFEVQLLNDYMEAKARGASEDVLSKISKQMDNAQKQLASLRDWLGKRPILRWYYALENYLSKVGRIKGMVDDISAVAELWDMLLFDDDVFFVGKANFKDPSPQTN